MRRKLFGERGHHIRTFKGAVLAAVASGSILLFGPPPGHAAVLSFSNPGNVFGGYQCADVAGGSLNNAQPVIAWDCHAGPNQQFEFSGPTIYALGGQRCLDVYLGLMAAGTKVQSYPCNGTGAQRWYYYRGTIVNTNSGLCLDAGNGDNNTQLVINYCSGAPGQQWQIK
jgi:hypothetical protein